MNIKYYATYGDLEAPDIAVFQTEKDRDEWVSFTDEFSKILGCNLESATFKRISLTASEAMLRIKNSLYPVLHIMDEFNPKLEWIMLIK